MVKVNIHMDFSDGSEIPYFDGKESLKDFNTHCLQFFNDFRMDVTLIQKRGVYINNQELLRNTGEYTDKEIRRMHNVLKIFLAGGLKWVKA